jgi:type IV pilus assembly protein PilY1
MNGLDGSEKWGIVFPEHFTQLKRLRDNSPNMSTNNPKPYFADGPITVYQKDANNDNKLNSTDGDKVYLYVGMRRGGRFMYGLDVSDPDTPKKLWKIANADTDFTELGQTWSAARATNIKAVATDPVVIFGAGYDANSEDQDPAITNTQGRGIYVVNARTGALVKFIQDPGMGSIAADLTVMDRDSDGYADRIYAVDTKANIWRIDIDDADKTKWKTWKIATLGGTGANARKFLNKPDVVTGTGVDYILVGSGDREHPFVTTVADRFYMIKDTNPGLVGSALNILDTDLADITSNPYQSTSLPNSYKGWKYVMGTGEKTVGNAITVAGTTYFPTNQPSAVVAGSCTANLGVARLYSIGYKTGNATQDTNGDGTVNADDRSEQVKGGGFLPSPTAAEVPINGKETPVVCSGPHCKKSGDSVTSTKRYRTYWRKMLN